MRKAFLIVLALSTILPLICEAQDIKTDTIGTVTVHAYSSPNNVEDIPASIGLIDQKTFLRFNQNSLLAGANTVPGVRMEERSPGSYRFSIRGSLLRSPFGVRNVKVYYNGFPLTDAGGNTYLNILDNSSIENIEIIKGPAGSIYGAGTGGVIILRSPKVHTDPALQISSAIGSYGLVQNQVAASIGRKNFTARLAFAQQLYDGYRDQSQMKRHAFNGDFIFRLQQNTTLSLMLLYSNLYYQTPGGLNLSEYNADPRKARPAAGPFKSAEQQKAAVKNNTPLLAATLEHDWNSRWTSRVALVGSHTGFRNPTVRNYEVRDESNIGLRNENACRITGSDISGQLIVGLEGQMMKSPIAVYGNNSGQRDTIQTDDHLSASIGSVFTQLDLSLPKGFNLTIAGSMNSAAYVFESKIQSAITQHKTFNPFFSPRFAILKKVNRVSIFANASRGFSPPSSAEVRPSTNTFNNNLQPESGWNYEVGAKASSNKLKFAFTAYLLNLNNTIVIRHDVSGADYFTNSGSTKQKGIESSVAWQIVDNAGRFLRGLNIWASYTLNNYHFKNYISGDTDLSGNKVTGIPPVVVTSGIDIDMTGRLLVNFTTSYNDHVPLNDANTVYAKEYFLLGVKTTYKVSLGKHKAEIFAGIDNALNRTYSLGNDLNAAGGRYYNAAPGRNYFGGLKFRFGL